MKHSAQHLHKRFAAFHTEHNQRVAKFHKRHAAQIASGKNGNSLLAEWERYVYNKGLNIFQTVKKLFN
ncbi:hypothetical protein DXB51_16065 [Bacillus cereus]|uniref:Uncharacterized protein n=1 Tax=Bacillus luti TaxID=2026191 RepID=A0ABU8HYB3_9BACI|nr:hypothetical protein [Bacillus luti]RGN76860.1 hypothetical protein DXB51_16065 [Bacillus cereus]